MSDANAAAATATASAGSGLRFMSSYQRCDFSAQESNVEILPKFEMGQIDFICGKYGPFSPNYPIAVPLWLALFLRETNTCTIRPSKTMSAKKLSEILTFENDNQDAFYPLPHYFFSLTRQLLRFAAADIPDAAVVHHLIDELEQRRIGKITQSIGALANADTLPPPAFNAGHLTASELLVIKNTLGRVVNDGVELRARAEQRMYRAPGATAGHGGAGFGGVGAMFNARGAGGGGGDFGASASSYRTSGAGGGAGGGASTLGGDTLMQAQQLLRANQNLLASDVASTTTGAGDQGGGSVDAYFGGAPGQSMGFLDMQSSTAGGLPSQSNTNNMEGGLSQATTTTMNNNNNNLMFNQSQQSQQPAPKPSGKGGAAKRGLRG